MGLGRLRKETERPPKRLPSRICVLRNFHHLQVGLDFMGGFSKVIWFLVAPSIVSVVLVQSSAHILVRRIASAWCVVTREPGGHVSCPR